LGHAEQAQHGQVSLAVAAVCGWVDQVDAFSGPEDVAGPQVAVDPCRLLGRVECAVGHLVAEAVEDSQLVAVDRALVVGHPDVGLEPIRRVELAPGLGRSYRMRQLDGADVTVGLPPVRRYSEVAGARVVRDRQQPAELVSGSAGRRYGL
jgi:hypothetical protein